MRRAIKVHNRGGIEMGDAVLGLPDESTTGAFVRVVHDTWGNKQDCVFHIDEDQARQVIAVLVERFGDVVLRAKPVERFEDGKKYIPADGWGAAITVCCTDPTNDLDVIVVSDRGYLDRLARDRNKRRAYIEAPEQ